MPITHVEVTIKTSKVAMLVSKLGWVSELSFKLEVPFETEENDVPKLVADTLERSIEFVPEGNWADNEEYVESATTAMVGTRELITNTKLFELKEPPHYEFKVGDDVIYSLDISYVYGEW